MYYILLAIIISVSLSQRLFISEYIHSSSFKAIEIYNPLCLNIILNNVFIILTDNNFGDWKLDNSIDLSNIALSSTSTISLCNSVGNGCTYTPTTLPSLTKFFSVMNGLASVGILHNGVLIDSIGPSNQYTNSSLIAGESYAMYLHTIIRSSSVTEGTIYWKSIENDPNRSNWAVYSTGVSNLGSHNNSITCPSTIYKMSCGSTGDTFSASIVSSYFTIECPANCIQFIGYAPPVLGGGNTNSIGSVSFSTQVPLFSSKSPICLAGEFAIGNFTSTPSSNSNTASKFDIVSFKSLPSVCSAPADIIFAIESGNAYGSTLAGNELLSELSILKTLFSPSPTSRFSDGQVNQMFMHVAILRYAQYNTTFDTTISNGGDFKAFVYTLDRLIEKYSNTSLLSDSSATIPTSQFILYNILNSSYSHFSSQSVRVTSAPRILVIFVTKTLTTTVYSSTVLINLCNSLKGIGVTITFLTFGTLPADAYTTYIINSCSSSAVHNYNIPYFSNANNGITAMVAQLVVDSNILDAIQFWICSSQRCNANGLQSAILDSLSSFTLYNGTNVKLSNLPKNNERKLFRLTIASTTSTRIPITSQFTLNPQGTITISQNISASNLYSSCVIPLFSNLNTSLYALEPLNERNVKCLNNCGIHGHCNIKIGVCVCDTNWSGSYCNSTTCTSNCLNGGSCNVINGTCTCLSGYTGPTCSVRTITCLNGGAFDFASSTCICADPYYGFDCRRCLNDCNTVSRGICNPSTGTCTCYPQYAGETCELSFCPSNCGEVGGSCDYTTGRCLCNSNDNLLSGNGDCVLGRCPNSCSGNGICDYFARECICNANYIGLDCSTKIE